MPTASDPRPSRLSLGLQATGWAFCAYFCMYAFRKPFAAAHFEGTWFTPDSPDESALGLKTALVISQLLGYALSKFLGIKVLSELDRGRRVVALLALIACAELALLGLGVSPRHWGPAWMFLNGLPLGMVWGLVFSFLEGRRDTELLAAGLSCSYIVASGAVRSVGATLLDAGVPESWMPSLTGLLFFPPLVLAALRLGALPPPDAKDEAARVRRIRMDASARLDFFRRFGPGLVPLTLLYMLLTAYRDFRDNFQAELFAEMGVSAASAAAKSEVGVALVVLAALAAIVVIRDNRRALFVIHALMLSGTLLVGGATWAFQAELVGPESFMWLVGVGLYLGYVPYGCVLFDRLIACTGIMGTSVFMIYVTDAFGYLGSIGVLMVKNFGPERSWLEFFLSFSQLTATLCSVGLALAWLYFARRIPRSV